MLVAFTFIFWYQYEDGLYHKTKKFPNGSYRVGEHLDHEEALCGKRNIVVLRCTSFIDAEPKCQECVNWLTMWELAQ